MMLANFNITELLKEQINQYLSNNNLTFSELKALILSKTPISAVHSNIVTIFTESKDANLIKVKKALESQAHKNQLMEDEQQKKHDLSEESKDEELKTRLNRELKHIPTQISSYETECRLLERKLARLMEAQPRVEVTQNPTIKLTKLQTSTLNEQTRAIDKVRHSLLEYELKIQTLFREQQTIRIKLKDIDARSEIREIHHNKRARRAQASVGYRNSGEGIEETLSARNQSLLAKTILDQASALEKKCSDLIQESEQINFPYFLEELKKHLNNSKTKLTSQEIDGLNAILKLMRQHMEFEQQAANTESSLKIKKQSISSQITRLNGFMSKLKSLQDNNPTLNSTNQNLNARNIELSISSANHIKLRQRLSTPTLLLVALTFIFCIPLILTVSGVIPFFIAPVLLYSLVSVPPALLFIATLGVGIAALVYTIKAHFYDAAIKTNLQIIETNTNLMSRNNQSLKTLETLTIPSLNSQIRKDESLRDNLMHSLENSQNQAKQAFKQAKAINPTSYSSSSMLSTKENNQQKQATVSSDESVDSVDSVIEEEQEVSSLS